MVFSAWACVKVGHRLNFHRKRRLARRVMAFSSFGVLIKARVRESHETPRMRAFRSSERLVRAKSSDGQSYKHRNWDDCRSKVGRVRFCTVPRGPVRLGRLSASSGDSRAPPSSSGTSLRKIAQTNAQANAQICVSKLFFQNGSIWADLRLLSALFGMGVILGNNPSMFIKNEACALSYCRFHFLF